MQKMNLTDEQQKVVAISAGRHLVLAPPGSGKTEMLSQRIVRAVESGIDPARMLCATFTNRAAFETRGGTLPRSGNAGSGEPPSFLLPFPLLGEAPFAHAAYPG